MGPALPWRGPHSRALSRRKFWRRLVDADTMIRLGQQIAIATYLPFREETVWQSTDTATAWRPGQP
jgi:hypothetical protein